VPSLSRPVDPLIDHRPRLRKATVTLPRADVPVSTLRAETKGRIPPFAPIVVLVLILFYRKPDAWVNPQFWAEDGTVFFAQQHEFGLSALFVPYAGYLHLIPRLIAQVSSLFPVSMAPMLYNASAILMTSLVGLKLLSPRVNLPNKPWFILSLGLVPHSGEIFLNATNIQWFGALALLLLVIQEPPRSRWQTAGDFFALILVGLTGPFSLLFAPVVLLGVQQWRGTRVYRFCFCSLVLILGLVQGCLVYEARTAEGASLMTWSILVRLLGHRFLGTLFLGETLSATLPLWVLFGFIALSMIATGWFLWKGKGVWGGKGRIYVLVFLLAGLFILGTTLFKFRSSPEVLLLFANGDRYYYLPRLLVVWSILIGMSAGGLGRRVAMGLVLLSVLAAASSQFQSRAFENYNWKEYAKQIERGKSLLIPINPQGWYVAWTAR